MHYRMRYLLLSACLFLFACGSEQDDAASTVNEDRPSTPIEMKRAQIAPGTGEERMAQIAPPPPVCRILPESEIISIMGGNVQIPMPATRSHTTFNSCQYEIDGPNWTGTLLLETPDDNAKTQDLTAEVNAGSNPVMIKGNKAVFSNENRILAVLAPTPYRIKFTTLTAADVPPPYDAAARRELLIKFAEAVTLN